MLATFVFWQGQRLPVQGSCADGVAKNALRGVVATQTPVELPFWKEENVGSEVALAEAGVAHQLSRRVALEQLDQAFSKLETASFATVWTAAHYHVAGRHGLGHA